MTSHPSGASGGVLAGPNVSFVSFLPPFAPQLAVHLIVSFRDICVFTLVLPLGTLFVCFVSAYVFQPEEIHETHCRVRKLFTIGGHCFLKADSLFFLRF